jgi:hypothetical protein
MSRRRIPQEVARITGRTKLHPARYRDRADPPATAPLGKPSAWMTAEQGRAWAMFVREIPWLCESDRGLVEIAATIRARLIAREACGLSVLNLLRLCLAQMGGSPSDRSKVSAALEENNDDAISRYYFQQ